MAFLLPQGHQGRHGVGGDAHPPASRRPSTRRGSTPSQTVSVAKRQQRRIDFTPFSDVDASGPQKPAQQKQAQEERPLCVSPILTLGERVLLVSMESRSCASRNKPNLACWRSRLHRSLAHPDAHQGRRPPRRADPVTRGRERFQRDRRAIAPRHGHHGRRQLYVVRYVLPRPAHRSRDQRRPHYRSEPPQQGRRRDVLVLLTMVAVKYNTFFSVWKNKIRFSFFFQCFVCFLLFE